MFISSDLFCWPGRNVSFLHLSNILNPTMRKSTKFQPGIAFPILICLLVFVASCTKEYSLDITVQPANSGTVNLSPSSTEFEEGTEVILSPVPNSGFKFASWSGSDASACNNDRIVMSKDMIITANFDLQDMIRLKTGSGLNSGAEIYFVALSKNVNYFDLTTEEKFNYDKTQGDWYSDGGVIPFTTDYKEIETDIGDYYFMIRASGLVMVTTITVISGKQTFEIYGTGYGVSVRVLDDTKSTRVFEEKSRKTITIRR